MSNENIVQLAQNVVSFEDALKVVREIREALNVLGPKLNKFDYRQRRQLKLQAGNHVEYPVMWYNEDDFTDYYGDGPGERDSYAWINEGWMSSSQWKGC